MNKILASLMVSAALCVSAMAQVWVSGVVTNGLSGTNKILSGGASLLSFQVTDTSGAANKLTLYDADGTTNRVNALYYTKTFAAVSTTNIFTNMAGVNQTNIFTTLAATTVTNAAATNEAPRMYQVTIPANGTVVITPDSGLGFSYGITMLSTSNLTYNAMYTKLPY